MTDKRNYNLHDCAPDQNQTLLLHAAVSDDSQAVQAWRLWRDRVDLDSVDPASFRLLPMVYRNQHRLGQTDAVLERLKGIYRHSWYKNQILYREASNVLDGFAANGIEVMLIKGSAMIARFYRDHGMRFMNDIDFLVRKSDFERAAGIMLGQNWQPNPYSSDVMYWYHRHDFKHGCAFKHRNAELDLHCQLLRFIPDDEPSLWQTALELDWQGHRVHCPDDTHLLFHTCVHGVRWSYGILTWIPDALTMLKNKGQLLYWDRLVEKAEATRTALYLRNALAYLADEFNAELPDTVLRQLNEVKTNWVERNEYRTFSEKQTNKPLHQAKKVFFQSCRYHSNPRNSQGPVPFSLTAWMRFLFIHVYPQLAFGWRLRKTTPSFPDQTGKKK